MLLGRWQGIGTTDRLEFFDDGRVSMADQRYSFTGTWVVLQDGRVKVEVGMLGVTQTFTGKIDAGVLKLASDGDTSRFQKNKP